MQSLFGQCPNAFVSNFVGASLRSRVIFYSVRSPHLADRILNQTCDFFSKSSSRKIGILKSHLICNVFPHHILRFQVKGVQRMQRAKGNGDRIRFMKSKKLFPAFVGREKLNHKLSTELKLERAPLLFAFALIYFP